MAERMKFKFKITEETTIDDVEKELNNLYDANVTEIPFNHIIKIAEYLGCEYQDSPRGSQERFRHPSMKTFGGYFGVHVTHTKVKMVRKVNFKKYLYKPLIQILTEKRNQLK